MTIPTPTPTPPGSPFQDPGGFIYWLVAFFIGPGILFGERIWTWWTSRKKLPGEIKTQFENNENIGSQTDINQGKALNEYANAASTMAKNYTEVLNQLSQVNKRVDDLTGEVHKLQAEKLELQMNEVKNRSRIILLEDGVKILRKQLEDAGIIPKFEIPIEQRIGD